MKFYFEGSFEQGKDGRLASVGITPSTNSRACRRIFVLVAKEVGEPVSGGEYSLGFVGEKKTPMLFPKKGNDNRILAMGDIPQPKHRSDGFVWSEKTTAKVLDESQGGGAWGAGSCFLALLEDGQRVVSNRLIVWENKGGELVKRKFDSIAEYDLEFGSPDVEML